MKTLTIKACQQKDLQWAAFVADGDKINAHYIRDQHTALDAIEAIVAAVKEWGITSRANQLLVEETETP